MNDSEMLATFELLKKYANLHEIYEVTTLRGIRPSREGDGEREVTLEIHDRGMAAGSLRYTVIATDEEGHTATGDPDGSIRMAMMHVHWYDLDRDDIEALTVGQPVPAE
jgi:hypothetical protein